MKAVHSAANAALKHMARLLQQQRWRRQSRQTVIEGVHLLQTFADAAWPFEAVYVPAHRVQHAEVAALLARLPENRITVVADAALDKITSLTQADDVMAVVALPEPALPPRDVDCIVLERVQDPGNVGTILRSALAAGVRHVLLSADCADVFSPKVLRAGMGAHAYLHLYPETDLAAWCVDYRHPVYATALTQNAVSLYELNLSTPAAWVFGNEGAGVSGHLLEAASQTVVIPMSGQTESLNVAMAATVCLFEQQRQRLNTNGATG